jgi:hypothetical protein
MTLRPFRHYEADVHVDGAGNLADSEPLRIWDI